MSYCQKNDERVLTKFLHYTNFTNTSSKGTNLICVAQVSNLITVLIILNLLKNS